MRWQLGRRSDNVEDARGAGRGLGFAGLSGGTILVVAVASYLLGVNPLDMLGVIVQLQGDLPVESRHAAPPANDEGADFVRAILGDTEDPWSQLFEAKGAQYQPPSLVLFAAWFAPAAAAPVPRRVPSIAPPTARCTSISASSTRCVSAWGRRRLCPGLRHRARGRAPRADAPRPRRASTKSAAPADGRGRGRSASPSRARHCVSGVAAYHPQSRHQWLDPGEPKRRSPQPRQSATTVARRVRGPSCRMRSPTAPHSSASAGFRGASRPATSTGRPVRGRLALTENHLRSEPVVRERFRIDRQSTPHRGRGAAQHGGSTPTRNRLSHFH